MRVLILEDNDYCRSTLVKIVKSCRDDVEVYAFEKRADAYMFAFENHIDLFLVDIILEPSIKSDSSGIVFADSIRKHMDYRLTPIIFITTLQGLEAHLLKRIHCYDYIEKPLGDGKLVKEQIREILNVLSGNAKVYQRECVPIRHDGIGYAIYLDEVIYIMNRRGVLYIHLVDDIVEIPNLSTKSFLKKIKNTKFFQPIYGTAVNAEYIEKVDFRNNEVLLRSIDASLPIGGRLKKRFQEEYMKWAGEMK